MPMSGGFGSRHLHRSFGKPFDGSCRSVGLPQQLSADAIRAVRQWTHSDTPAARSGDVRAGRNADSKACRHEYRQEIKGRDLFGRMHFRVEARIHLLAQCFTCPQAPLKQRVVQQGIQRNFGVREQRRAQRNRQGQFVCPKRLCVHGEGCCCGRQRNTDVVGAILDSTDQIPGGNLLQQDDGLRFLCALQGKQVRQPWRQCVGRNGEPQNR